MSRAAYSAAATPSGQARCGPASHELHRRPENAGRRRMPHDRSMRSQSRAAPERSGAARPGAWAAPPGDSRRQRCGSQRQAERGEATAGAAARTRAYKSKVAPPACHPTSVPSGAARCLSSRVRLALREGAEFSPAACRTRGGRAAAAHVLRPARSARCVAGEHEGLRRCARASCGAGAWAHHSGVTSGGTTWPRFACCRRCAHTWPRSACCRTDAARCSTAHVRLLTRRSAVGEPPLACLRCLSTAALCETQVGAGPALARLRAGDVPLVRSSSVPRRPDWPMHLAQRFG
jgi:hypothetical protein